MKFYLPILSALLASQVSAAQPMGMQQLEIEGLIARLGASNCRFNRNGRWYNDDQAQAHLQRKYAYLHKRGMADNAEHFIERAASGSSYSGKPYRVSCPGQPVIESGAWFRAVLLEIRKGPKTTPTR